MRRQFWSTVIVSLVLLAADLAYTPGCLVGSLLIDVALGLCWICFACSACRFDLLFALGLGLHLMLGHSCCNLVRVTQRTASLLCVAWVVLPKCSTSPPAVTRLTVYRQPNIVQMKRIPLPNYSLSIALQENALRVTYHRSVDNEIFLICLEAMKHSDLWRRPAGALQ